MGKGALTCENKGTLRSKFSTKQGAPGRSVWTGNRPRHCRAPWIRPFSVHDPGKVLLVLGNLGRDRWGWTAGRHRPGPGRTSGGRVASDPTASRLIDTPALTQVSGGTGKWRNATATIGARAHNLFAQDVRTPRRLHRTVFRRRRPPPRRTYADYAAGTRHRTTRSEKLGTGLPTLSRCAKLDIPPAGPNPLALGVSGTSVTSLPSTRTVARTVSTRTSTRWLGPGVSGPSATT